VCAAEREQTRISGIDVRQAAPPLIGLLPSACKFANTVLNPIDRQEVPSRTDRGYARACADRALVTECHPALGPVPRGSMLNRKSVGHWAGGSTRRSVSGAGWG